MACTTTCTSRSFSQTFLSEIVSKIIKTYMASQYQVHFSEDDLFHIEGPFCRMHANIVPTPEIGHFVVRSDGIYEIKQCSWSTDTHYDVILQNVVTQTQDGDVIVVYNKDKYYKCHNKDNVYGFRKITLLSLMNTIYDLEHKLSKLQNHVNMLIQ